MKIMISVLCFVLMTNPVVQAGTYSFGKQRSADIGHGCIGGWVAGHGTTSYHQGGMKELNGHLTTAALQTRSGEGKLRIVLHCGVKKVADTEESAAPFNSGSQDLLDVNWIVTTRCARADIFGGQCDCKDRSIRFDVWLSDGITRDGLVDLDDVVAVRSVEDCASK